MDPAKETLTVGDLVISLWTESVAYKGKLIYLGRKEYDILVYLAKAEGRPVSAVELLDRLWDRAVDVNNLHVNLRNIRKKLDRDVIITRHRFGYTLKGGDQ